ncbi:uncharacterized protein LOC105358296 isoform X1 [Oryzias latipes]|uniref:uncharacterized protein LOC105358296 isoform X1 n=1 Tax=Oryzias latipes TaxID=8090 RepID=UPI000CE284D1|nr:uncharacterized protein LOC105358296 isoform X1 [Oryzias latipes]
MNLCNNFVLSLTQLSLLSRGLTFIPSKCNSKNLTFQSRHDLQEYHRRIKLTVHYKDKSSIQPQPFTLKSDWTPPSATLPPQINHLIDQDISYFENDFKIIHNTPNLSGEETKALKELAQNNDIVIKPADKGSLTVIMDKKDYLYEGYRQLNDVTYYHKLNKPIYLDTIPLVDTIINNLLKKKFINKKQKTYLQGNSQPRPRRFYMLPKIHKDPQKWTVPSKIPPGRPIVSDCESETYYTAEYLDFFLNPLSNKHDSYLKDTYHFIEKIKQLVIPADSFLFTMDIDSLYTNIDHKEGIDSIKRIFQKYPDKKRPDKELLQLLEINLNRNDFEFNGEFFVQIKGTAMGKKFAPAYANIFMAEWESSALQKCALKPLCYYRYLDDIWGVWTHSEQEFGTFLGTLNSHNPSIKLKSTCHASSVDFLDTTTFKGSDFHTTHKLDIKVYFKPTDTHALLHKTSFHPKHTFAGLVKSQLLRFHRICTQQADFKKATKILFSALYTRGYSRSFLRKCFKSFQEIKPIDTAPLLPIVTTHSAATCRMVRVLRRNFRDLVQSQGLLEEHRFLPAYRRNKNLKDILIRAKLPPPTQPKSRALTSFFKHLDWICSHHNKNVFPSLCRGSPHSQNCIYIISCSTCGIQYVGETGNTLLVRFTQHRHNITKQKNTDTYLVQHFMLHGWDSVRATIVQMNPRWSAPERRKNERIWISKLDTLHPRGLNEKKTPLF